MPNCSKSHQTSKLWQLLSVFFRKRGLVSAPQIPCPRVQQRQSHAPQGRESGHWAASSRARLSLLLPRRSWKIPSKLNWTTTWWLLLLMERKIHWPGGECTMLTFHGWANWLVNSYAYQLPVRHQRDCLVLVGNVVTCQRSCLKPSKVDMLVFLTKNL